MQRAVIDDSKARAGNSWAIQRREPLLRQVFITYAMIHDSCHDLLAAREEKSRMMATLLGSAAVPGPLRRLPCLCDYVWPHGQADGFYLLATLLRWQGEKLASLLAMLNLAPAGKVFGDGLQELGQHEKKLGQLLLQANDKLYDVLLAEAGNPLLLRLLLENPHLSVTLWQKDLADLCEELFPGSPEAVYLYAGKSYFNGYWLSQALAAFDQALAIRPELEEARRKGFIVRGMLRDQKARS